MSHSLVSHGGNDKHDPSMVTYIASTLKSQRGKGGGGIGPEETLMVAAGSNPNSNMAGRRREDDFNLVYPTLGADYARQAGGHPGAEENAAALVDAGASVRRLTPRECERLQDLPDDWTMVPNSAPDSRRYAALGDAVTASVGEWIGRRLLAADAMQEAA